MTVGLYDQESMVSSFVVEYPDGASKPHGISVGVAALFLLGSLAGAGIVAMPHAFLQAGWWAILLVTVMSIIGCFTGFQLSWCWSILQENWPEYNQHTRNPYPAIAFRAGGHLWKHSLQACINLSSFGASVAFLIYASTNIAHLVNQWLGIDRNFCYMVLVVATAMLPFLFLGTPKDFWPIAIGALLATALAIVFIMLGTYYDMAACKNKVYYPGINSTSFISAYCTVCFAFGGHASFPTLQNDMKRPAKFPYSVLISYISLFVLYFPMPVLAYSVYGHTIFGTIEANLSTKWIQDIIMVLITGHVLFAFFIIINPVAQDFERILGIPLHFSWKRTCTRTATMVAVVILALSLPDFNLLLELVGGTTLAATAYIFPGPLYLVLRYKTQKNKCPVISTNGHFVSKHEEAISDKVPSFIDHISSKGASIPLWEYAVNFVVVTVGVVGAMGAIYGVIEKEDKSMRKPCYLSDMFLPPKIGANITHYCYSSSNLSLAHNTEL